VGHCAACSVGKGAKQRPDLSGSPAWNAIETQRARWIAELPEKRGDLLPWLAEQDPGMTLLDLVAFCTGTLLDRIASEEKATCDQPAGGRAESRHDPVLDSYARNVF
jgi:hypothetical protein